MDILTASQRKKIMARARMSRSACRVGFYGVRRKTIAAFMRAFEKHDVVRVKIRSTYRGEMQDVVKRLQDASGTIFVGAEKQGNEFVLTFWNLLNN